MVIHNYELRNPVSPAFDSYLANYASVVALRWEEFCSLKDLMRQRRH